MRARAATIRFMPDAYLLAILAMVALASVWPVRGSAAADFAFATKIAIALLFFLHGARLSREAVIAGAAHWRLHLAILALTFGLFPLLGLLFRQFGAPLIGASLASGLLFLACLPSTVQSSIAFTALARGNVAAAVCAASGSNLLGVIVTPLLAAALIGGRGGGVSLSEAEAVGLQLLLPFAAGQLARPWMADWIGRHGRLVGLVDRGSILMVVYGAFAAAVVGGLWSRVSAARLVELGLACGLLLALVLASALALSRLLRFSKADEIAVIFCGSKKSLASGAPMASILFPPAMAGPIMLPLMMFHQLQLMACAVIARRYAARGAAQVPARMSPPLRDRVALVTGATRGIGRACALALGAAGAKVIALGRTQGALEELDDAIQRAGGEQASLVAMDLTNAPGVDQLGHEIFQRHRRLDILVHAAGYLGGLRPASHIPPKVWDQAVAVNLTSAFRLIRSLEPLLKASDGGRVIFLTSGRARRPAAFWGSYAATKAGLEALARCWAEEVDGSPLRVILLDPGAMRTRMRKEAYPGEDPDTLPDADQIGPLIVELASATNDPGLPDEVISFRTWRTARAAAAPGTP